MNEFNKFLTKYHIKLITIQAILIFGAVLNQTLQEHDLISCEAKAGVVKVTPPLLKF